jgi:hypothetical protein
MSRYGDRARTFHEAIRQVLLHEWDPIGVRDIPEAEDEYDSYVGQLYGMLLRREPGHVLEDHLWRIETEHMGLCSNRQHTKQIVERLLQIAESLDEQRSN